MKILKQTVAQGSYGLQKVNPQTGVRISDTMTVWHVLDKDGITLATYRTRKEARAFARDHPKAVQP